ASHIALGIGDDFAYITSLNTGEIWVYDLRVKSNTFHKRVGTIRVDSAPHGLRGISLTADGHYLLAAVPNRVSPTTPPLFSDPQNGEVVVVDLLPPSQQYWASRQTQPQGPEGPYARIKAGNLPFGVTATIDPNMVLVTNFGGPEKNGVEVLRNSGGTWTAS